MHRARVQKIIILKHINQTTKNMSDIVMDIEREKRISDTRTFREEDILVNFYEKKKRGVWLNFYEESAFRGICPLGVENLIECLGLEKKDSYYSPCSVINMCSCRNCEKCLKHIVIEKSMGPMLYLMMVLEYIPIDLAKNEKAESFVYWINDGEYTKIGKANSVTNRLKQLQTGQARNLKVQRVFPCKSEKDSNSLERYFHRELKRFNIRNEWFGLPIIDYAETCVPPAGTKRGDSARLGLVFGEYKDENGVAPAIGFF